MDNNIKKLWYFFYLKCPNSCRDNPLSLCTHLLLLSAMSKDVGNHEISFPCTLENIVKTGSDGPIFDLVRDLSWLSSSGPFPNDFKTLILYTHNIRLLVKHFSSRTKCAFVLGGGVIPNKVYLGGG